MEAYHIIAEIKKNGLTQKSIAQEARVSPVAIHQVIYRKSKSRRLAQIIARKIGKHLYEVFHEYMAHP